MSDFSDVIYTTSKNEFKMMWLRRNAKVLDSFPPQNGKFYTIRLLSSQVHWHSALFLWQAQMMSPPYETKNYGLHTIAHVHNIARLNCRTCTSSWNRMTTTIAECCCLFRGLKQSYQDLSRSGCRPPQPWN